MVGRVERGLDTLGKERSQHMEQVGECRDN